MYIALKTLLKDWWRKLTTKQAVGFEPCGFSTSSVFPNGIHIDYQKLRLSSVSDMVSTASTSYSTGGLEPVAVFFAFNLPSIHNSSCYLLCRFLWLK
jgi:hypothetical protein